MLEKREVENFVEQIGERIHSKIQNSNYKLDFGYTLTLWIYFGSDTKTDVERKQIYDCDRNFGREL